MPVLPSAAVPPIPPAITRETKERRSSSELAALLPSPVFAGGYKIEVLDAGFSAPQEKFPASDPKTVHFYSRAAYFFTYRVSRADGKPLAENEESHVVFRGFSLPDDFRIDSFYTSHGNSSDATGKTLWSDEINPRWASVGLDWSVTASNAPPDASGTVSSPIAWKNIPIPAKGTQEILVNEVQTTSKGTTVTLQSVEQKEDMVLLHFALRPQPEVSDYEVSPLFASVATQWDRFSFPLVNRGIEGWAWTLASRDVAGQKFSNLSVDLRESSSSWKDPRFFKNVQVRLPVASLLKVKSPSRRTDVPPVATAQNSPPMKARLEWNDRFSSQNDMLNLWLSPSIPQPTFQWWPESATAVDEEGKEHQFHIYSHSPEVFWHSDNTPRGQDESSWRIYSYEKWKDSKTIDVIVQVKRAQVFDSLKRFANIPLPPYGKSREFKAGEFEGESIALRRIAWFTDPKELARETNTPYQPYGARLALVFDYQPLTIGQPDGPGIMRYAFDGVVQEQQYIPNVQGDLGANDTPQTRRLTFLFPLPTRTTKTISISLKSHEFVVSQEPPIPLLFKGLEVPPLEIPPPHN